MNVFLCQKVKVSGQIINESNAQFVSVMLSKFFCSQWMAVSCNFHRIFARTWIFQWNCCWCWDRKKAIRHFMCSIENIFQFQRTMAKCTNSYLTRVCTLYNVASACSSLWLNVCLLLFAFNVWWRNALHCKLENPLVHAVQIVNSPTVHSTISNVWRPNSKEAYIVATC